MGQKRKTRQLAVVPVLPRTEEYSADERYNDVVAELKRFLRTHQFATGALLQQVSDEELYGEWKTFKAFVEGELRITERTAYRLIFASKMYALLKRAGCKILPVNERQLRPLAALGKDLEIATLFGDRQAQHVLAWNRACANKQKTSPTYVDVQQRGEPSYHA